MQPEVQDQVKTELKEEVTDTELLEKEVDQVWVPLKERKERDFGTMNIYKTDDNKTYVTVSLDKPEDQALTAANSHFRINKANLGVGYGWEKDDLLYFNEEPGATKAWVFWRKKPGEK